MTICDICGKPVRERKEPKIIHTHYACKAWQAMHCDVCEECIMGINEAKIRAEAEFYQNKRKEREQSND